MNQLTRRATALEAEVAQAEEHCASLVASVKAAAIEAEAAKDPRQFATGAFATWLSQPRRPADVAAAFGIVLGLASGASICWLIASFILN